MRILVLILLLSGCTTWYKAWDDDGWTKVIVETEDAMKVCSAMSLHWSVGCTVWFDRLKRCVEIVPPNNNAVMEHENKHCAGYQHI